MPIMDENGRILTAEEIEELIDSIEDAPEAEGEDEEQPIQSSNNSMYDRWIADDKSINKYGL